MTMHGTDLIAIVVLVAAGFAACYILLLWKLRSIFNERQLKIADQLGALDDAIRALETRLSGHHGFGSELSNLDAGAKSAKAEAVQVDVADPSEESEEIAPEIQAVIAAATVATVGQNAAVRSVKAAPSAWTQQGRVMVQGGHNLRVRP